LSNFCLQDKTAEACGKRDNDDLNFALAQKENKSFKDQNESP